jgi:hypothetical protein
VGTFSALITCLPVTGLRPPNASVAAIVARSFALTPTEHCRVYRSVACVGLLLMYSYAYISIPIA